MQARRHQLKKSKCSVDQKVQLPRVVVSFSLSQPFFRTLFQDCHPCIQFQAAFLGYGICLFYISCTLLGHTLWMQACVLYLSCALLGPLSLGVAMSDLHFLYLAGSFSWNVDHVCFTFLLCVIALLMMYVFIYMLEYG